MQTRVFVTSVSSFFTPGLSCSYATIRFIYFFNFCRHLCSWTRFIHNIYMLSIAGSTALLWDIFISSGEFWPRESLALIADLCQLQFRNLLYEITSTCNEYCVLTMMTITTSITNMWILNGYKVLCGKINKNINIL